MTTVRRLELNVNGNLGGVANLVPIKFTIDRALGNKLTALTSGPPRLGQFRPGSDVWYISTNGRTPATRAEVESLLASLESLLGPSSSLQYTYMKEMPVTQNEWILHFLQS